MSNIHNKMSKCTIKLSQGLKRVVCSHTSYACHKITNGFNVYIYMLFFQNSYIASKINLSHNLQALTLRYCRDYDTWQMRQIPEGQTYQWLQSHDVWTLPGSGIVCL